MKKTTVNRGFADPNTRSLFAGINRFLPSDAEKPQFTSENELVFATWVIPSMNISTLHSIRNVNIDERCIVVYQFFHILIDVFSSRLFNQKRFPCNDSKKFCPLFRGDRYALYRDLFAVKLHRVIRECVQREGVHYGEMPTDRGSIVFKKLLMAIQTRSTMICRMQYALKSKTF